jgi:5'-nucleotidase / UDP-sugar diphosphatase
MHFQRFSASRELSMKLFRIVAWTVLSILVAVGMAMAAPATVRILHVNDFHGFAEPTVPFGATEQVGGVPWLAAKVLRLRSERPTLLLAAGDMIQGNNWANLFQGESVVQLMNLMKFDAMTLGNHEFDFGQDVLKKRIAEAQFPVLGANVEGIDGLKPYVITDVGGVKVAILGVVTDDTPVSTHPRNVVGLAFKNAADTLARTVPELRKQADVIVVLSHVGYSVDRQLAEQVPGIDLIVGGHSHTRVDNPSRVGETVVAQAWEHGKTLGVIDITVENGHVTGIDGRLDEIRPDPGAQDPAVASLVETFRKQVDAVVEGEVGVAEVALDGENVRTRETNLGDLITDIMRSVSGADATIINGGGIRTSIARGPIRVKDIYTVLPFDNYIVAVRLTGKQIREALEHGVARVEEGAGAFPQVSGISFTYNPGAPAGSRVRDVLIGGKPLDPDREYAVASNDFIAAGGDGYAAFGDAIRSSGDFAVIGGMMKGEKLVYNDAGRWLRDVVIDSLREKKTVAPAVEGRITEVR